MTLKGPQVFDDYYQKEWRARWPKLKQALLRPMQKVSRVSNFSGESHFYEMDLASLFPALALDVQKQDRVLDLCAAPGGKSLMLIENGDPQNITLNDISQNRFYKLKRILQEYIPKNIFEKIKITNHDGARWCLYEKKVYDKILVDAPCSGERHLLYDETELQNWSLSRTKNLAKRQYALLASALQVAKPGGFIVYATCSISKSENDGVISRLHQKKKDRFCVCKRRWPLGEPTEWGWQILPDQEGFGPLYFAVLQVS